MGYIRAIIKFTIFALFCLVILPLQSLLLLVHSGKYARFFPYIWLRGLCLIFGIKVQVKGTPHTSTQTLYISNHLSYLDLGVIGSIVKASFVARSDAASWAFFGYLAKLNQTAYVARSRSAAKQDANAVNAVIASGRNLILFPEGTSTDGQDILPFKSSLFALALGDDKPDLHLQPLTVQVINADKRPVLTQEDRDIYAWHRDMDESIGMFDHWWAFAKHRGAVVKLVFHPVVKAGDFTDRKVLAKTCQDAVSNGVAISNKIAA